MRKLAPYLIVLLCFAAYAGIWRLGFAQDDAVEIQYNRYVAGNGSIAEIFSSDFLAGVNRIVGFYRPAVILLKRMLHGLGGGSAMPHHALNLALHIGICLMLYRYVRRWDEWAAALAAAALFAVHPVAVEVVAANTGLKDLLVTTSILALLLLLPELERATGTRRVGLSLATFALALLGALSKEQFAVVVPLLVLQFLVRARGRVSVQETRGAATPAPASPKAKTRQPAAPPPRSTPGTAALILPAVLIVVPIALAMIGRGLYAGGSKLGGELTPALNPLVVAPLGVRLLTSGRLLWTALSLFVYPAHLMSDYTYDALPLACTGGELDAWAGLALAAIGGGLFVFAFWQRSLFALPLGMAIVCWLPVSQVFVLIPQIFAERFLYLFYLPLAFLAGMVVARALAWAQSRIGASAAPAIGGAFALLVVVFAVRTAVRVPVWQDNDTLLARNAVDVPDSLRVQAFVASMQVSRGEPQAAIETLDTVLGRADPCVYTRPIRETEPLAHRIRGQALRELGRFEEAQRDFRIAVEAQPEYLINWFDYGMAYDLDQKPQDAVRVWEEGLTKAMTNEDQTLAARVHSFLVAWYSNNGDDARAALHADAVIANPQADAQALSFVAERCRERGDTARAARAEQRLQ